MTAVPFSSDVPAAAATDPPVFVMRQEILSWQCNVDGSQASVLTHEEVKKPGVHNESVLILSGAANTRKCVFTTIPPRAIPAEPRNDAEGVRLWFRGSSRVVYTFFMSDANQVTWQTNFTVRRDADENDWRETTLCFADLTAITDDETRQKFALSKMKKMGILYRTLPT